MQGRILFIRGTLEGLYFKPFKKNHFRSQIRCHDCTTYPKQTQTFRLRVSSPKVELLNCRSSRQPRRPRTTSCQNSIRKSLLQVISLSLSIYLFISLFQYLSIYLSLPPKDDELARFNPENFTPCNLALSLSFYLSIFVSIYLYLSNYRCLFPQALPSRSAYILHSFSC